MLSETHRNYKKFKDKILVKMHYNDFYFITDLKKQIFFKL